MKLTILLACLLTSAPALANNHTKDATEDQMKTNDNNSTAEILKGEETGDHTKVEIVKQIRRLNDDGSYTIGYEADDGTFKIESRDVRGNVKGTFGYIDKDGEIKRVAYSSSTAPTPVPVSTTTTTTSSPAMMIVRMNKTVSSSTTRRPLGTVVYPTRIGYTATTRGTAIQSIGRRRNSTRTTIMETSTERQKPEETSTSNILNLYKPKSEESVVKRKHDSSKDDLVTKQTASDITTKLPHTVKPVYEHDSEKEPENAKANTFRRQLPESNPHMIHLQQSAGDDSTDVYGGHQSMGTVRPLFTTTTPRPRLVPFHSIIAARQKLQQQFPNFGQDEQETTIEASTGRVFDHDSAVTTNPVPVVHIAPRDQSDQRLYQQQPIYHRPAPAPAVHFHTNEYLRDNPGAPVPIGNQRPFLHYEYQNKVLDQHHFLKDSNQAHAKGQQVSAATIQPYEMQPVTRIIPIPVDERGVPIQGYQARFVNPYRPQTQQPAPPVLLQQRLIEPALDEMNSFSTPVSTRDLKRLLQILILRQNRLQTLMDQIVGPQPGPYQQLYRQPQQQQQYDYNPRQTVRYQNVVAPRYQEQDERYDYRYEPQEQRQQDVYYNQVNQYDPQYDSQRFVPRRRLYTRPVYDTVQSSSNQVEETPEYLPADVREALLLKMLMLAISPDFVPKPPPVTELTTAAPPTRKQVRNIQILGEEGSMMDEMKRPVQRH